MVGSLPFYRRRGLKVASWEASHPGKAASKVGEGNPEWKDGEREGSFQFQQKRGGGWMKGANPRILRYPLERSVKLQSCMVNWELSGINVP